SLPSPNRGLVMNRRSLLTFLAVACAGCAPHYVAKNFDSYSAPTNIVAIAPIANLAGTRDALKPSQIIREAIHYERTRRHSKYTAETKDIVETDKRIRDWGLSDSAAATLPGPEICRVLGVDAVMKGTITRFEKKSGGSQIASAVLSAFTSGEISGTGSEVKSDVAIYDGTDGKLIWQHNIEKVGG